MASFIEVLGMIPLALLWNPRKFVISSKKLFWRAHPLRINVLGQSIYVVQGAANIAATVRQRNLSSFTLHQYILKRVFNLPDEAVMTYQADNSGRNITPHAGSNVEPRNRVEFLATDSVHQLLLGPGLASLSRKFQIDIAHRLHALWSGQNDGVIKDDFFDLFIEDLWTLDDNVWKYLFQVPRFLSPTSYTAKDRAVSAIKAWHSWAREHIDPASTDDRDNDLLWGSQFFRDRQGMFQNMDGFDADAIASQDLAFLWGALNNVVISSFWTTLECIRNEVHTCQQHQKSGSRIHNLPIKASFMPFGAGDHLCPGRRFAKVITLLVTALLVNMYDVEILGDAKHVGMSMRNFGFGMLGPDRTVRVRRRKVV
ncbi:hypothetical protein BDV06DRAFT_218425 [Aspergillus oleicola]